MKNFAPIALCALLAIPLLALPASAQSPEETLPPLPEIDLPELPADNMRGLDEDGDTDRLPSRLRETDEIEDLSTRRHDDASSQRRAAREQLREVSSHLRALESEMRRGTSMMRQAESQARQLVEGIRASRARAAQLESRAMQAMPAARAGHPHAIRIVQQCQHAYRIEDQRQRAMIAHCEHIRRWSERASGYMRALQNRYRAVQSYGGDIENWLKSAR